MSEVVEKRIAEIEKWLGSHNSIGYSSGHWLIAALRAALIREASWMATADGHAKELLRVEADAARWKAALELPAMFHKGGIWTVADSDRWQQITGSTEVTTKVMCDHIRAALTAPAREGENNG